MEKSEDLENHALILMDPYAAILSNKTIGMAFKSPKRHIFSFHTIQYIEMKYLFVRFFGRCADILTFHGVWGGHPIWAY